MANRIPLRINIGSHEFTRVGSSNRWQSPTCRGELLRNRNGHWRYTGSPLIRYADSPTWHTTPADAYVGKLLDDSRWLYRTFHAECAILDREIEQVRAVEGTRAVSRSV